MDYEFRRDSTSGDLLAEFAMGHEIIGHWLIEELADNEAKYHLICRAIEQLQHYKSKNWQLVGNIISIELDNQEAHIFANVIDNDDSTYSEDGFSLYHAESEAFCGLEDFYVMLTAWHQFLRQQG